MSYVNLVNSKLTMAFNLVKDLAKDAVLVKRDNAVFDFASNAVVSGSSLVTVKCILIKAKTSSRSINTTVQEVMFKTSELNTITDLDKLIIDDVTWKFSNILQSDGYITVAQVSKE